MNTNAEIDEPELSVVIPALDDREALAACLACLARQRQVLLEAVVCDGGSGDGTPGLVTEMAATLPFPVLLIAAEPGRGGQFNAGAAVARGKSLLFLHADSLFPNPLALRRGLDTLAGRISAAGHQRFAGRFALVFRRREERRSFGYYFYEAKARLNRSECIHGDQGLLLPRTFFAEAGPFPGTWPMLAETRFADRLRERGEWLLLPAEIETSARRFETEGLAERQTLNAMLMNCAAIGWEPFFRELPHLYRSQPRSGPLLLLPLLEKIRELLTLLPPAERRTFWQRTGAYVRDNGWQPPLSLDLYRNFRKGLPPGSGATPCLAFYERAIGPLLDNAFGRFLAASLTRLWFRWLLRRERRRCRGETAP